MATFGAIFLTACAASEKISTSNNSNGANIGSTAAANKADISAATPNTTANTEKTPVQTAKSDTKKCFGLKKEGKTQLDAQTFPVDFAPFDDACFVTFHDPEFTNPPLDSEFYIYRSGKEIYDFPDRFNGMENGCWLESVTFEDVNGDNLKDILIVGKCGAMKGAVQTNSVYLNTGKGFRTNLVANDKITEFEKTSEIRNYVRAHQAEFAAE